MRRDNSFELLHKRQDASGCCCWGFWRLRVEPPVGFLLELCGCPSVFGTSFLIFTNTLTDDGQQPTHGMERADVNSAEPLSLHELLAAKCPSVGGFVRRLAPSMHHTGPTTLGCGPNKTPCAGVWGFTCWASLQNCWQVPRLCLLLTDTTSTSTCQTSLTSPHNAKGTGFSTSLQPGKGLRDNKQTLKASRPSL